MFLFLASRSPSLIAMASNLEAMASNLINRGLLPFQYQPAVSCCVRAKAFQLYPVQIENLGAIWRPQSGVFSGMLQCNVWSWKYMLTLMKCADHTWPVHLGDDARSSCSLKLNKTKQPLYSKTYENRNVHLLKLRKVEAFLGKGNHRVLLRTLQYDATCCAWSRSSYCMYAIVM